MNIDTILKFFVPKDASFFPLFEDNAKNIVMAAEQLKLFMVSEGPAERAQISLKITELRKIGDQLAINTYSQLNKSFVTPFERKDIHELACILNDVVGSINHISKCIGIYHPARLDVLYYDLSELIYQITLCIGRCLNLLRDAGSNKKLILKTCNELRSIEQKAKETFYSGISSMLDKEKDITELIKNKEILENFERCVNVTGSVTSNFKSMLLTIQ